MNDIMEYKLDYYNQLNKNYSYAVILSRIFFTLIGAYYVINHSSRVEFHSHIYCQMAMLYLYSSVVSIPINIHIYNYGNEKILTGLHYGYYIILDTICASWLAYISMTHSPLYKYVIMDIVTTVICICGHVGLFLYSYQKQYQNIQMGEELEDEIYYQSKQKELSYQNSGDNSSLDDNHSSNGSSDSFDIIDEDVFES